MTSNHSSIISPIFPVSNDIILNNQINQSSQLKKYWCHLCHKEFSHIYEFNDVKCVYCGKTFCEIIEIDDTSNASHPIHFEPYNVNNINGQNNINNLQNDNNSNTGNNLNYINNNNRHTNNLRRRANHLIYFLTNYLYEQSMDDNLDNIITHLMLHDTNKYGNPPAAKKAVESLKKYKINEEKIKEFGFENACAVCKDEFNIGEECLSMPCNHYFHGNCLMPWLKERNSCPVCRYELPTDDADFEEMKKIKMKNDNNNIINSTNNTNVQG